MADVTTLRDREEVEADLLTLFEDLGRLLATPAVSEDAEARREWSMRVTIGEIRRLQGLLGRLGVAGSVA